MAVETTLVLVKPDGVRRGLAGEVVGRLERKGYDLRGARLIRITPASVPTQRAPAPNAIPDEPGTPPTSPLLNP